MGRPGPMPKPTALRVLEGNPSHRPLPKGEPAPGRRRPACPAWLPIDAKREWQAIAPKLHQARLLTEIDGTALGAYCLAVAQLRAAQKVLDKGGFTVATPAGYEQQRPEVAIVRSSLQLIRAFSAEFGLTPAARARISLPEEGEEDGAGILS